MKEIILLLSLFVLSLGCKTKYASLSSPVKNYEERLDFLIATKFAGDLVPICRLKPNQKEYIFNDLYTCSKPLDIEYFYFSVMEEGDKACTSACQIPMNRKDFVDLFTKHIQEDCALKYRSGMSNYTAEFGNCFMKKLTSRKNFLQEESGLLTRQVLNQEELNILKWSNYDLGKKNCKCIYHIVLKKEFDELDSFQKAHEDCFKFKTKVLVDMLDKKKCKSHLE
jgi:hypothetical protein